MGRGSGASKCHGVRQLSILPSASPLTSRVNLDKWTSISVTVTAACSFILPQVWQFHLNTCLDLGNQPFSPSTVIMWLQVTALKNQLLCYWLYSRVLSPRQLQIQWHKLRHCNSEGRFHHFINSHYVHSMILSSSPCSLPYPIVTLHLAIITLNLSSVT